MAAVQHAGPVITPYGKCVVAALPELALGIEFVLARWHHVVWVSPAWLTAVMQVEFLALHSAVFLGLFRFWNPPTPRGRTVRAWVFCGPRRALRRAGREGGHPAAADVARPDPRHVPRGVPLLAVPGGIAPLWARWLVAFVAFMVSHGIAGTPESVEDWVARSSALTAGAIYFFTLAAVELSALYVRWIPRHEEKVLSAVTPRVERS